MRALFQLDGVIAIERLEADGYDVQVVVEEQGISTFLESLERLCVSEAGVHEGCRLLGPCHLAKIGVLEE